MWYLKSESQLLLHAFQNPIFCGWYFKAENNISLTVVCDVTVRFQNQKLVANLWCLCIVRETVVIFNLKSCYFPFYCKMLMTALVVCRVAHSFSLVSDKYIFTSPADIVVQPARSTACYLAPLRACFVRDMKVSWLLTVYLRSMIGHLSLMAPSAGAVTTTTTTHSCMLGGKKWGEGVKEVS